MSTEILTVLADVRQRLSDPRRWLQGGLFGFRQPSGVVQHCYALSYETTKTNCWCLGNAIDKAIWALGARLFSSHCALRSDVEMHLLITIHEQTGVHYQAVHQFNDRGTTAHADVLRVLDATIQKLQQAA